ncbi:hypothetical protein QBC34DRAFT_438674 [Podospora aff. communis PSN243]|uniref:Uncharacterized protein n=1 Tax=Podospora aff. communis PSN243 TaxID=3040156 RepID=A0AAV9GN17_9PEZI|nr:hypothetical protein QBC34DRAFT_438674 [Podospora aff. communis PSN243]
MHSLTIIATLLLATVSATPLQAPQSLQPRQDPDWAFDVYQSNERCTGARDNYSGNGSLECQRGVFRNGSFGSYTNNGVREGCTVYLYDNDTCDASGIVDVLEAGAPEGCQQPVIVVNDVASFDVVCD